MASSSNPMMKKMGLLGSSEESDSDNEKPLKICYDEDDVKPKNLPSFSQPSERLNICDKDSGGGGPKKDSKRFSIWTQVLLEQHLEEGMDRSLRRLENKEARKLKVKQHDRSCENYAFWNSGRYAEDPQERRTRKYKKARKKAGHKSSSQSCDELHPNATNVGNKQKDSQSSESLLINSVATLKLDQDSASSKNKKKKKKKKKSRREKSETRKYDREPQKEDKSIATVIARRLKEPNIELVIRIVNVIGGMEAMKYVSRVEDIENAGGIMTGDGLRRRTPGGVFFHLVKNDKHLSPEQIASIFHQPHKRFDKHKLIRFKAIKKPERPNLAATSSKPAPVFRNQPQLPTVAPIVLVPTVRDEDEVDLEPSKPPTKKAKKRLNNLADDLESVLKVTPPVPYALRDPESLKNSCFLNAAASKWTGFAPPQTYPQATKSSTVSKSPLKSPTFVFNGVSSLPATSHQV